MKSKIVVFKALAAIVAIVGAIASVSAHSALAATSGYIRYTTTSTPTVREYCIKHVTCDKPGNFNCVVQVSINGGPTVNYNTKIQGCASVQADSDAAVDAVITTLPPTAILLN